MTNGSPLVGRGAVRAVLLDVHAEEADLGPVHVLEGKQGFGPVGERLLHLPVVHKPGGDHVLTAHSLRKLSCNDPKHFPFLLKIIIIIEFAVATSELLLATAH